MSEKLTFSMIALIIFCIVTEALYQLCFKHAAHDSSLKQTLAKPVLWLGVAIWSVELVAWASALEKLPLSVAFPLMSVTYVTTLGAGALIFNEHITKRHAAGALLIAAGVACVGAAGL